MYQKGRELRSYPMAVNAFESEWRRTRLTQSECGRWTHRWLEGTIALRFRERPGDGSGPVGATISRERKRGTVEATGAMERRIESGRPYDSTFFSLSFFSCRLWFFSNGKENEGAAQEMTVVPGGIRKAGSISRDRRWAPGAIPWGGSNNPTIEREGRRPDGPFHSRPMVLFFSAKVRTEVSLCIFVPEGHVHSLP